ncbi:MAG: ABC transporter substrate-binding protein [Chloroflexi bacterium]|nr:ABC transporter substrate-binding protein [Chloroflexota bacterium]
MPPPATATPVPIAPPTPTPTPQGVEPKRGGVLRARSLRDFEPWDTYAVTSQFSVEHTLNIWSNLIALKAEEPGTLEADLAERWELSSDGTVLTIFLVKTAKWHNGQPFTAQDALFNLDRAKNPPPPSPPTAILNVNLSRVRPITKMEAVDASTLRLTIEKPSASFLANFAAPFLLMYHPSLGKDSSNAIKNPIGTGPFVVTDYKAQNTLTTKRFESYHRKDERGRALPFLDGVEFQFITDVNTARAAFRTGRLDCGCGFDFTFQFGNELKSSVPDAKILTFSRDSFAYYLNNRAPWDNLQVRKAVMMMMDFKEVHTLDRGGLSFYPPSIMLGPESGGRWGLPASEMLALPGFKGVTEADRAEGRRILTAAGVDPSKVTVKIQSTANFPDVSQGLEAQFRKMGFQTNLILTATGGQLSSSLMAGDFDFSGLFGGRVIDDISDTVLDYTVTGRPRNYGKWSDAEVDRLAADQEGALDPNRRKLLVQNLQRRLIDQSIFVPFVNSFSTWPLQKPVEGFRQGRFAVHMGLRMDTIWLNK